MSKNPYKNSLRSRIIYEGEKIYPINEEADKKCLEENKIDNWAECFYNIKEGIFKKRYIELMSRTENNKFFEALNYEYGINDYSLDLNKALKIYKTAADTSNDTLSMFRLYRIYKNEYKKFDLFRNTVLEKYYLYKCCAYLTTQELNGDYYLKKRFNVVNEMVVHFNNEDPNTKLFDKFFKHLRKNYNIYNLKLDELILIQSVIRYITAEEEDEKVKSKRQLINLSLQNNIEATYKLVSLNEDNQKNIKELEFLYKNRYYRSYLDYALYLNNNGDKIKAMNVLKTAIKNGYYYFTLHYIDIFFEVYNFDDIMKSPKNRNEFLFILGCIVDTLIADGIYSFFEFIYISHVCTKHFNFQKELKEYFFEYTKEMVNFLIKITDGSEEENKKKIKRYYINSDFFNELYFACGIIYYYGFEGILEKNYYKGLNKINVVLKNSNDVSYKRFCYTYMLKIKEILYKQNKFCNTQNDTNIINDNDLLETKKELYKMYYNGISDERIGNLSSSFFYYLSKMYNRKIGNNGDLLMEYLFMNKSANSGGGGIGTNSFIVYYRKYKAQIKLQELDKDKFNEKLKSVEGYKNEEGYGEDGSICPICYDKKKSTICLPCKHFFCDSCLKNLEDKKKCPICRTLIIITYNINTKKEDIIK